MRTASQVAPSSCTISVVVATVMLITTSLITAVVHFYWKLLWIWPLLFAFVFGGIEIVFWICIRIFLGIYADGSNAQKDTSRGLVFFCFGYFFDRFHGDLALDEWQEGVIGAIRHYHYRAQSKFDLQFYALNNGASAARYTSSFHPGERIPSLPHCREAI
jgi:hypothetical protein